jgi:hypothetical protein
MIDRRSKRFFHATNAHPFIAEATRRQLRRKQHGDLDQTIKYNEL